MVSEAMDWDSDLSEESAQESTPERTVLPDGDYDIEITQLEKDRFVAGPKSKIPSCPKAILHIKAKGENGETATFLESLFLCTSNQWKNLQFFICIGLRKHGDNRTIQPWNKVEGCTGRAKIGHRTYTDRNGETQTVNTIAKWLEPEEGEGQPADNKAYDGDF